MGRAWFDEISIIINSFVIITLAQNIINRYIYSD